MLATARFCLALLCAGLAGVAAVEPALDPSRVVYFQYYGDLYATPSNFSGLSEDRVEPTLVGTFSWNKLAFLGPVCDDDVACPNMYMIGAKDGLSDNRGQILKVNRATSAVTVLYTCDPSSGSCVETYGGLSQPEGIMAWDSARAEIVYSANLKLYRFKPGVDTVPRANGTLVVAGGDPYGLAFVRGDWLFLSTTDQGIWRRHVRTSEEYNVVPYSKHSTSFKGLYVTRDASAAFYTTLSAGVWKFANPGTALNTQAAEIIDDWPCSFRSGLAYNEANNQVYWTQNEFVGSRQGLNLPPLVVRRPGKYYALNRALYGLRYLDNAGNGVANSHSRVWMMVLQKPFEELPNGKPPVPRGPKVIPPSAQKITGIVGYNTNSGTGNFEYFYSDQTTGLWFEFLSCPDEGGGMRSGPAYDREYGWLYLICAESFVRINLHRAVTEKLSVEQDPTLMETLSTTGVESGESGNQIYGNHYIYGMSAGFDEANGVFYFVSGVPHSLNGRHVAIFAWVLGQSFLPHPILYLPETDGSTQGGRLIVRGKYLYLPVGNMVDQSVNGLYRVTLNNNTAPPTYRKIFSHPYSSSNQMYAYDFDWTKSPPRLWFGTQKAQGNTYYESIRFTAWVGSEDSGAFSGPDYTAGSIFQLGSCTFGCQVWDSLSLMWDPTTHRLWSLHRNGDGEYFVVNTKVIDNGQTNGVSLDIDWNCIFKVSEAATTHGKQSIMVGYGAAANAVRECPCPEKGFLPSTLEIGVCTPVYWYKPVFPGRCDPCMDCPADVCEIGKKLPYCRLDCCQLGFANGMWDSANDVCTSQCTAQGGCDPIDGDPPTSSSTGNNGDDDDDDDVNFSTAGRSASAVWSFLLAGVLAVLLRSATY